MIKQIVGTWTVNNLEELQAAVTEAIETARCLGHHPSTVYPTMAQLVLVEETLSDGSPVLNLELHERQSALPPTGGVTDMPLRVSGAARI